jgi:DNA-directed RNA polymerase alpha subunit
MIGSSLGKVQMPNQFEERLEGPIKGLRLPYRAWESLKDDGIKTIEQLRAVADQLESLPGIGPKTAKLLRKELARVAAPEESFPSQNLSSDFR